MVNSVLQLHRMPPEHRHFFMTDVRCTCPQQCHKTVAEFKWNPETARIYHVFNHPCEELAATQDFSTEEAHEVMKVASVHWATQEAYRQSKGFFGEPGSGRIQRRVQHNGQIIIAASDGPIGYASHEGGFHTRVFPHLITAVYPEAE